MKDPFGRVINYLRVAVTDRCNLCCSYCRASESSALQGSEDVLSFEEIVEVVKAGVEIGIDKVRLTGGEPLMRPNIVTLVAMIAAVPGIRDFAMSTNGILLAEYARELFGAGLQRVNVSLDAVDPEYYGSLTGGGNVEAVLDGILAARRAGLHPIKLNCVVNESSTEAHAQEVKEYAHQNGLEVRFIPRMDLQQGKFSVVDGGSGGDCKRCNRLRLTSRGLVKPCLFSDIAFSVRTLGIREALLQAIRMKPATGTLNRTSYMRSIGG